MELIILAVYCAIGSKCVKYCKFHLFGVTAEYFAGDVLTKLLQDLVKGFLFGWLAIPVALLHKIFFGGSN